MHIRTIGICVILFFIGIASGCSSREGIVDDNRLCLSGIYPHLAYYNHEAECGTGAVVPWAGSLWTITYAPHSPYGSSDKLYQITPQLEQIAASVVHTSALAEALWKNKSTRESRLLATMIYPLEEFSLEKAERWAEEFDTMELTDMLCFRLVRNVAGAEGLVAKNFDSNDVCRRYFALRLAMNLLIIGKLEDIDAVRSMAEKEYAGNFSETKYLSFQIIEEIDFLKAK